MKPEEMLEQLREKFSTSTLEQIAWLETRRSGDIATLSAQQLEQVYYRFFPKTNSEKVVQALAQELELKRLRSIVLADAQYLGIYRADSWLAFNGFMKNRSVLKKPLNYYTIEELPLLIQQFKSMRSKFDKAKMQIGSREWFIHFGFTLQK